MTPGELGRPALNLAFMLRDKYRRLVSMALYGSVTVVAFAGAFFLRFELAWPESVTRPFLTALPLLLVIRLIFGRALRLSTSRWRFIGTQDVVRLFWATTIGSVVFFVLSFELGLPGGVPRSVIALEWVLTTYGVGGMWLAYRVLYQKIHRREVQNGTPERTVLLIGAGDAAAMLVGEMTRTPTGYKPVGMVDDDPHKWGTSIHGVEVIGSVADLPAIAAAVGPEGLIIATPSAGPDQLLRIVGLCEETGLPFKLLPGIPEVLTGEARLDQVRTVHIEDLLGREPVTLELPELAEELNEKCVLITGAAGSIGSELSRQIATNDPGKLLLLDQAESPLVELDLELRERFPDLEIVPLVRDVTHEESLESLFQEHRPHQVFHAAAYKHVPMMECNPEEAVRNNVVGTWNVVRMAGDFGTQKFVLISTDKAVNPVNVMGATKRLAEQTALEAQERYENTTFAAVRFGNVLGSNGSVIPLFRKQMEEGKPLTVTHPEVTRYFMTIPEAVQLVLQASLLEDIRGRVAMLEMGEPMAIVDLAKKMLRLAGQPAVMGRDIVFTGLRPGEKLHEELVAQEEDSVPTAIPKVHFVLPGQSAGRETSFHSVAPEGGLTGQPRAQALLRSVLQDLSKGTLGSQVPVSLNAKAG